MKKKSNRPIWVTNEYNIFKPLKGNRPVDETDVVHIMESMERYGWIGAPIEVNENMEVAEGQHRLEAAKRLGLDVEYIVREGLRAEHCAVLNSHQKNWGLEDFVNLFAEEGRENYIWFRKIMDIPNKLSKSVVIRIGCNMYSSAAKEIRKGKLKNITKDDYIRSMEEIDWLSQFDNEIKYITSSKDALLTALLFAYRTSKENDKELANLTKALKTKYVEIEDCGSIQAYLKYIDLIYKKVGGKKVNYQLLWVSRSGDIVE